MPDSDLSKFLDGLIRNRYQFEVRQSREFIEVILLDVKRLQNITYFFSLDRKMQYYDVKDL